MTMHTSRLDALTRTLARALAIAIIALFLHAWWLARYQPIEMDLAMLHYCAYLINEHGLLLYRDIFENNFPGPFLFHALIGQLFGYGASAVRWIDTGVVLLLAALAWQLLKPVSRLAGATAGALFGCLYLAGGTTAAFQRDYIATVPLALALWWACTPFRAQRVQAAGIGALCGLACSFKPNLVVAAPALYWLILQHGSGSFWQRVYQSILPVGAGFVTVLAIPFLWALRHADLNEFVRLYQTYTPIYVNTRIDLYHYASASEKWQAVLGMQANHLGTMLLFAGPGLGWAWWHRRDDAVAVARIQALALMTFAMAWHEVIAGKYWFAHLLPPYYFVTLCFCLLLARPSTDATLAVRWLQCPALLVAAWLSLSLSWYAHQLRAQAGYDADNEHLRSKRIASYLNQHLEPGDKVQSLDGSGDGQGALLLAGAVTATRFVEDIPLYLQPDAPATQAFRREFLTALAENPPAFIVYIHNFFHPAGGNRLKEFSELDAFIEQNYNVGELAEGEYTIFRRRQ